MVLGFFSQQRTQKSVIHSKMLIGLREQLTTTSKCLDSFFQNRCLSNPGSGEWDIGLLFIMLGAQKIVRICCATHAVGYLSSTQTGARTVGKKGRGARDVWAHSPLVPRRDPPLYGRWRVYQNTTTTALDSDRCCLVCLPCVFVLSFFSFERIGRCCVWKPSSSSSRP